MRKNKFKYTLALSCCLTLGSLATVISCGCSQENVTVTDAKVVVTGGKNGVVGDKIQLTGQVFGTKATKLNWVTSDEKIATVNDKGLVTLVAPGFVEIRAILAANDAFKSSPVHITVYGNETAVKKLDIISSPNKINYKKGESFSLEGLKVGGYDFIDGVRKDDTGVDFALSDLKFSVADGTKLTTLGKQVVTISKDGFEGASFEITVSETVTERKLYVQKNPVKGQYLIGKDATKEEKTFSSEGLEVRALIYVDGKYAKNERVNDFKLSLKDGTEFFSEGSKTIYVSCEGCVSTSFSVMVYTKDLSLYDYIKNLQNSRNFQAEVFNSVGTTRDKAGFHYLRTYNEDYYDEIDYQNVINPQTQKVEFNRDSVKSQTGYTSYKTATEYGVMQYKADALGDLVFSSYVSENMNSWWDRAETLASLFSLFNLKNLPVETLNGRYLSIVIEKVPGDDEDGTKTIANYPLINDFLSYCGWSSNLITIMDRFTVSINEKNELVMSASFGYYGLTEVRVSNIGTAQNPDVEKAIANNLIEMPTVKVVDPKVSDIGNAFKGDNFNTYDYGKDGISTTVTGTYNQNYFYKASTNKGVFKNPKDGFLYNFHRDRKTKKLIVDGKITTSRTSLQDYINNEYGVTIQNGQQVIPHGQYYFGSKYPTLFGDKTSEGQLYTFSQFEGFSTDLEVCYQSFDNEVTKCVVDYFGGEVKNSRIWFIASYTDKSHSKESLTYVQLWNIAFTGSGGSGSIQVFGDFGKANLSWVDEYLATIK